MRESRTAAGMSAAAPGRAPFLPPRDRIDTPGSPSGRSAGIGGWRARVAGGGWRARSARVPDEPRVSPRGRRGCRCRAVWRQPDPGRATPMPARRSTDRRRAGRGGCASPARRGSSVHAASAGSTRTAIGRIEGGSASSVTAVMPMVASRVEASSWRTEATTLGMSPPVTSATSTSGAAWWSAASPDARPTSGPPNCCGSRAMMTDRPLASAPSGTTAGPRHRARARAPPGRRRPRPRQASVRAPGGRREVRRACPRRTGRTPRRRGRSRPASRSLLDRPGTAGPGCVPSLHPRDRDGAKHVAAVGPAQQPSAIQVLEDHQHVLAAGAGRIAEGGG